MLALGPTCDVDIPGSDDTMSPLRLHVIVRGTSPRWTMQETWAYSPSSTLSAPNENGTMLGGSEDKNERPIFEIILFTIKGPSVVLAVTSSFVSQILQGKS